MLVVVLVEFGHAFVCLDKETTRHTDRPLGLVLLSIRGVSLLLHPLVTALDHIKDAFASPFSPPCTWKPQQPPPLSYTQATRKHFYAGLHRKIQHRGLKAPFKPPNSKPWRVSICAFSQLAVVRARQPLLHSCTGCLALIKGGGDVPPRVFDG